MRARRRRRRSAILADDGEVVATFDADQLFDYRARRPPLEIVDGRLTKLTWPELVLRRTRLDERDLLVLVGPEPDYRWRAFDRGHGRARRAAGGGRVDQPGRHPGGRPAHPAGADHRHRGHAWPAPRRGIAGPDGTLRVPSALVSALEIEMAGAGVPALGYFAQVPHYVSGPYATAALELLRAARHPPRDGDPGSTSSPRSHASCAPGSTPRPASTRRPAPMSSDSRRCTTSNDCRRATTSSPTSSGSCATRAPAGRTARRAACRGRRGSSTDRRSGRFAGSAAARHPAGGSTRRRAMVSMSGGPFAMTGR